MRKKTITGGLTLLSGLLCLTSAGLGQTVTAVPKLDLNRYMGSWYEIARLPDKKEKQCVGGALVLYAAGEKAGRFQVVSSCQTKGNNVEARNASGKVADKAGDGQLKISYLWPFSQKYWVLAVGPEYEWALVGSPDHKTLWILSRTEKMAPEVLLDLEGRAATAGFNRSKIVMVVRVGDGR